VNVTVIPPPLTYLRSTELIAEEHQIPLIVNEVTCNPSVPLRVSAIAVDQEPAITSVGSHSFSETHVGCPDGDLWFDWTFDPSAPGMPTTTIDSVPEGTDPSYWVAGGNYTITVTALPSDSTGAGFALIRGVNVCTDPPGGGFLILEGGGDPEPNAAGGCGGGELP
jgi:hypothetical protein